MIREAGYKVLGSTEILAYHYYWSNSLYPSSSRVHVALRITPRISASSSARIEYSLPFRSQTFDFKYG